MAGPTGENGVSDKDLAAERLAAAVKADMLIILTDVEKVAVDFGKPSQRWLDSITLAEAQAHHDEGQFPPGSMGPKMLAAIRFLKNGGERITLRDKNGTLVCTVEYNDRGRWSPAADGAGYGFRIEFPESVQGPVAHVFTVTGTTPMTVAPAAITSTISAAVRALAATTIVTLSGRDRRIRV